MLVVALGTDDRKSLTAEHFGDARYFAIYEVDESGWRLLEYRDNVSPEERMHGDPNKAKSIMKQMRGCDILLGHTMGPNFVRMRDESPYLPVISRKRDIEEALSLMRDNYERISSILSAKQAGTWDKKPVVLS